MNGTVVYSVMTLGGVAALLAVVLYVVAKKFMVHEDPRIDQVAELLPGANCGGCGYPGCRGFAEILVKAADQGDLSGYLCPPGGNDTMQSIAGALGLSVDASVPTVAVFRCQGSFEHAPERVTYDGAPSCTVAHMTLAGSNGCPQSCLGLGDCVEACSFGALKVDPDTGLIEVDEELCVSCGACVKACPRGLFEIRPMGRKNRRVWVACRNQQKGAVARKNCARACIGCMRCVKACPEKVQAIRVENNLAWIDPKKCIACGLCVQTCPTGAILATFTPPPVKETAAAEQPKPQTEVQS